VAKFVLYLVLLKYSRLTGWEETMDVGPLVAEEHV